MYIFKTSGKTFNSVISNQKHAFSGKPNCYTGELILVSKNKSDCQQKEKQIQYIMRFERIREAMNIEIEKLWPGNSGRWKYIIDCYNTIKIENPFNLEDILSIEESLRYGPVRTFVQLDLLSTEKIMTYLEDNNVLISAPIPEEQKLIKAELAKLNREFSSAPSDRKEDISERIERNLRLLCLLKRLHTKKCQICEKEHPKTEKGEKYCEVHHISEISKGSYPATDNCLVVCPECHIIMHRIDVFIKERSDNILEITIDDKQYQVKKNIVGNLI